MLRMILALILSAAIVLLTGPHFIAWLRKLKLGQTIYELGPESHRKKQGTPIMGGLFIALGCVVAFIVAGVTLGAWDHMLALLFVSIGSMAVGFGDDWIKMVKKRHEGLTPWQKIIGQAIVCVGFACYCYFHPEIGSEVHIPFTGIMWDLGIFYSLQALRVQLTLTCKYHVGIFEQIIKAYGIQYYFNTHTYGCGKESNHTPSHSASRSTAKHVSNVLTQISLYYLTYVT